MSLFSRGSHGRGRGRNNFLQRGHRRPRFSTHFCVDPQELNQLFQARFFKLAGQGVFHPHPRPQRPPYQPHQNISGIHIPPHVSIHLEVPVNDGWKDIVNQIAVHHHGFPTVAFPFPSPLPHNQHAHKIDHISSLSQSSHESKRLNTTILEPLSRKR
jgi:hypothetical protein